ncbi:conserved hypothetical protein [Afipia carboxidovorans OM5]|uniref:Uncharacterized protein n=1 Tax=Afipia carboxidovorans (strain ATCC 49405 / DSM 1227 / KCTC 32145 / OM5) TaxID=504832 RepID=B6JB23_AFIC5|nr:hypothetical protein [Afipia carboxidovorans]ACI92097.1 conserved hypothetical protein [Afipia carboxidovorans OM5]AEI04054.1 hypothetical protein OCA4_c29450 [Afipia carboxidovorans OM4]AEI07684.1 hypothetical protein OCA5_c29970 [Afipia carboxidovorans OM5]
MSLEAEALGLLPLPRSDGTLHSDAWPDEMRPGKAFSKSCMTRLAGRATVGVFEAYKLLVMPQHLFDAYSGCRRRDKEMPDFQEAYAFTNDAEWETVDLLLILCYRPMADGTHGRSHIWREDLDALSRISPAA